MKATCDICGKEDTWIEPLVSEYATEEVKGVCSDCLRTLNSHLDDFLDYHKGGAGFSKPDATHSLVDSLRSQLDTAYAEIERLKAIEISYRELEKRFIEKCERDNNRWKGDKDAE